ncbi:MAG: type II secretion system F family protein, partial [Sarcina sp.]
EIRVFPLMLSSMIKIGEEAGSLDDILSKTADFYDDELERAIEAITSIIEPIMLVVMGIVVGFLIISVLTPMFEMFHTI